MGRSLVTKMSLCASGTPARAAAALPVASCASASAGASQGNLRVDVCRKAPSWSWAAIRPADGPAWPRRLDKTRLLARSAAAKLGHAQVMQRASFDDLGHEEQAVVRPPARCADWPRGGWLSLTTSSRRRSAAPRWTADSGVYSGSMPVVSTALICSTMSKKPLILVEHGARFRRASVPAGPGWRCGSTSSGVNSRVMGNSRVLETM